LNETVPPSCTVTAVGAATGGLLTGPPKGVTVTVIVDVKEVSIPSDTV
jgi:hypothetical protein